jgi:ABC-type oligopeptide transport system substrate-binding subunit
MASWLTDRKRLLLLATAVSLVALFAVACGSAEEEAPAPAPAPAAPAAPAPAAPAPAMAGDIVNVFGRKLPADAAPLNEQFVRLMYPREGESVDFAVSVYNPGGGGFASSFSLAMLDTDLGTAPGSALSWEASDDLTDWTFHIDPDLNWSDGMPVSADDFVYTWRYYADPDHAYDFSWYFGMLNVKNYSEINAGELPLDAMGVEAVDEKTLVFHLDGPAPYVPGFMMYGTPLASHQAEKYGPYYGNDPATAVSMTPWILEEWIPNQGSTWVPNANYNGRFKPYVERIRYVFGEREFDAFLAGEIDSVNGPFSPADQELLMRDPELLEARGLSPGDFRVHYLFFDFKDAPFDDVKVRQAFAKAIDRDSIIKNVVGEAAGIPAYGVLMPGFPDAVSPEDLMKYQGFDPAAAQALLAEAGFPNGAGFPAQELALRDEKEFGQAVAAAVALQLKENLNIDVTVSNKDYKAYMASLNGQELEFAMVSYGFDYVDASNFMGVFKTDGRHNWNDAEWEALRITAGGNSDLKERSAQMVKLQELMSERVGGLFLWQQVQNQLHRPYLKGSWREENEAGWTGLQFPNWSPGFGVQNIYEVYIGDDVKDFDRPGF